MAVTMRTKPAWGPLVGGLLVRGEETATISLSASAAGFLRVAQVQPQNTPKGSGEPLD